MCNDFLLVHKSILPEYYERVIETRNMVDSKNATITEACKKNNISRSTFYKYKDYVFYPGKLGPRKAILSFRVEDVSGVLSSILGLIHEVQGNVLTINQDMPIHGLAFITMTLSVDNLSVSFDVLLEKLRAEKFIKKVEVVAYE